MRPPCVIRLTSGSNRVSFDHFQKCIIQTTAMRVANILATFVVAISFADAFVAPSRSASFVGTCSNSMNTIAKQSKSVSSSSMRKSDCIIFLYFFVMACLHTCSLHIFPPWILFIYCTAYVLLGLLCILPLNIHILHRFYIFLDKLHVQICPYSMASRNLCNPMLIFGRHSLSKPLSRAWYPTSFFIGAMELQWHQFCFRWE